MYLIGRCRWGRVSTKTFFRFPQFKKEKKHKTGNDKIERSSIAIAQQREKHVVLRNYNVTLTLQPNMAQLESCVFCLMTCMVESLVDRRGELASRDVRSVTS